VGDAYLRYMWHDSVMQAALRFGRDPEIDETVVVAHTAALRDDLPVVGEGDVVKTYSAGEKRVAEAVADLRGSFTTADVRERLSGDPNPRSVRRQLAALAKAGHLNRTETPNGVANQFSDPEAPGAGQVELPSIGDAHPDEPTQCISYTWAVRVGGGDSGGSRHRPVTRATLPSPETAAAAIEGDPPPS
jgi:hypothetical protein